MMRDIAEPDWKIFRHLHSVALERFCKQILSEVERINSDTAKTFHQKYSDIYAVLRRRDKEIAQTFDDLRRSTALARLASMKARNLVTEDDLLPFSQETSDAIDRLLEAGSPDPPLQLHGFCRPKTRTDRGWKTGAHGT